MEEIKKESIYINLPVYYKAKFWLEHSEYHFLSSNEYSIAYTKP